MGRRLAAGIAAAALAGTGLVLVAPAAGAATFDVTSGADDGSVGTLRWAVEQAGANPGDDVVNVASSVTAITLVDCEAGRVAITSSGLLTINGGGATVTQTCAGEGVIGGIGDTTINDLTLTGGGTDGNGGGIELNGALTLDGVTVTGNEADGDGGGIYTVNATITDSVISGNRAERGGGIYLTGDGELSITSSTIADNISDDDGGGVASEGDVEVTSSEVRGNEANGAGGGLDVAGSLTVTGSTVADNDGGDGFGGIRGTIVSVVGSTISGNVAGDAVGGVGGDTVAVVRSAVTGNLATLAGGVSAVSSLSVDTSTVAENLPGGLDSAGPIDLTFASIVGNGPVNLSAGGIVTSFASVVALADGADCDVDAVSSEGYNFAGDASCAFGQASDTNSGGDPMVTGLGLHDGPTENLLPVSGSPLLNKVPTSDAACSATDQRGFTRPANGSCDIGAVEVRQVSAVSTAVSTPYLTSITTDLVPLVTDPDGVLSVYEVQGELHGSIDAQDGGLVTYTPDAGFSGTDSYQYVVCSTGEVVCTSAQTVSITVGPGPGPAAAAPVTASPTFTG